MFNLNNNQQLRLLRADERPGGSTDRIGRGGRATDGYLRATPRRPVTAVAMDAGSYISAGDIPVFRFSNGDTYTGAAQTGGTTLYGFISSTPFQYVDYHISVGSRGGDFATVDTFYVPTPEPGTWGLGLAGLALAGLWRRRLTDHAR